MFSTTQSFAPGRCVYGIFCCWRLFFFLAAPGRDCRVASENRATGNTFPRHLEICVAPRRNRPDACWGFRGQSSLLAFPTKSGPTILAGDFLLLVMDARRDFPRPLLS